MVSFEIHAGDLSGGAFPFSFHRFPLRQMRTRPFRAAHCILVCWLPSLLLSGKVHKVLQAVFYDYVSRLPMLVR